ncbi:MAG: NAD-dependent epimerase/dehydratase family protein [Planctomycetes bacterium]|nr:NAD-dependent epimerase/dehydratase family protein [Planctomycetota bacterium]
MRFLITGGAGFLGSHLAEHLLERDHSVMSIDNYATGDPGNLPNHDLLSVVEGDIADGDAVTALCETFRPEVVIHAAASYQDPDDWETDVRTNIAGTVNVVRACQAVGTRRLIYLQTALCYGRALQTPIPRSHPVQPFSSYAITKTAGEQYVSLSGLSAVSLRLANIYGPRLFCGPQPAFYKRLKAGQRCHVVDTRRDFMEIADFLRLMDAVIASDRTGCYNVSSGADCTIKEVFDLIVERLGVTLDEPVEVRAPGDDDVSTLLLDPRETERDFGWRAEVPLEQGTHRLLDWYDEHGVEQTYSHLAPGGKG